MTIEPRGSGNDRRHTCQLPRGTDARSDFGHWKRIIIGFIGGALLIRGLRRRSFRGIATALAGGWLLARALGTDCRSGPVLDFCLARNPINRHSAGFSGATAVSSSITVGRPAAELYEAWRDPDRLSRVMGPVAEVTSPDGDRLHWRVNGPRGQDVSWETRYVEETPGEYLRWETSGDAMLPNKGSVCFGPAPGDRGTEVTLSVDFDPPGGALGDVTLEALAIVPEALTDVALDRFKSLVETGEIPTLERNPSARGEGDWL